jgi:hypothetical protein
LDKQVTKQDGTATGEEKEESLQLHNLATSILEECKAGASLSTLDTAIYLFREALDRCPHPMPSNMLMGIGGRNQKSVRVWSVFRF